MGRGEEVAVVVMSLVRDENNNRVFALTSLSAINVGRDFLALSLRAREDYIL